MELRVTNAQRGAPVKLAQVSRLARCAVRRLRIRARGTLEITFIDTRRMRTLNRRFMRRDDVTDVLSFRYEPLNGQAADAVLGEILIAPSQARAYARRHRIAYEDELSRYVVHGLLHWLGYEDETPTQQRKMRTLEDALLTQCARRDISLFADSRMQANRETSRT